MSLQADSNLVEVLREWSLKKLSQYVELLKQWRGIFPVQLLFYLSLLANGCSSIGRMDEEVVLRCNNKVVRNIMDKTLGYPEKFKEFKGVIEEILRLRILTEEERMKLFVNRMYVEINLGELPSEDRSLHFLVYGKNRYTHLLNLGNISLYLLRVDVRWDIFSTNPLFKFWVLLSKPPDTTSYIFINYVVASNGEVRLAGKSMSGLGRWLLLGGISYKKGEEEKIIEERVNMIIKALNEKYYVVNDLLRDTEEILVLNTKGLITMLLY